MAALSGQVAMISGGLGDIGRACAIELARRGADIAVGDLRENDQAESLRDEVKGLGRRFRFDEADVTDEKQIDDWLSVVEEEFGAVTLGVSNAAIVEPLGFSSLTATAWRHHLDVNFTGSFLLANGIAKRLVELGCVWKLGRRAARVLLAANKARWGGDGLPHRTPSQRSWRSKGPRQSTNAPRAGPNPESFHQKPPPSGIFERTLEKPGRLVFLGSWAAESVQTHNPAYCVSKAGLRMLCRSMALECARHDIMINEGAPGIVEAGLSRQLFEEDPGLRDAMVRNVPTGQLQSAGEVARLVAWHCDPENRHMTGATLQSDGGISLVSAAERSSHDANT